MQGFFTCIGLPICTHNFCACKRHPIPFNGRCTLLKAYWQSCSWNSYICTLELSWNYVLTTQSASHYDSENFPLAKTLGLHCSWTVAGIGEKCKNTTQSSSTRRKQGSQLDGVWRFPLLFFQGKGTNFPLPQGGFWRLKLFHSRFAGTQQGVS